MSRPPEALRRLSGVSRTALWTLYCRATFAERGDLEDPEAIRICRALGDDLRRELGPPARSFAERSRTFDRELQAFLDTHPGAPVVSLGEGLETQRFRVRGYGRWITVDLKEALAVRELFIQPDPTHQHLATCATDLRWFEALDPTPTFVVAQGLFMYLHPGQVASILQRLDRREGPVKLMFDVVPRWVWALSRLSPPLGRSLRLPPMGWGSSASGLRRRLAEWLGRDPHSTLRPIPLPRALSGRAFETIAAVLDLGG